MTRYSAQRPDTPRKHSEVGSLDDVRATLAADLTLLGHEAPTLMPGGRSEALSVEQLGLLSNDRQMLLRAAIADLRVMEVFLHGERH